MLKIVYSDLFEKHFSVLPEKIKHKTLERLQVFVVDQFDSILNNHDLHGEYKGCRSINITGNIRVVYRKISDDRCLLLDIGTHSQLYE